MEDMNMRRSDRELTDLDDILDVMRKFHDTTGQAPWIVVAAAE
jgi:hypothetical protein